MAVILGCIIVIGSVLAGFSMAGGHVHALIHPSEFVTIGGAALGALVVSSPPRVLKDLAKGMIQMLKGNPFTKAAYRDMLQLLYSIFRLARRDGLLALDNHLSSPEQSELFAKYPKLIANHHVTHFICEAMGMAVESRSTPEQLGELFEMQIKVAEHEHHEAVGALAKTADAMPGFGIVAAVLGIVITMGAISGPAEEIGHKVGAALVGTFLGILISYGFLGPMGGRMETLGAAESAYFRTIASAIVAFQEGLGPKDVIMQVSRGTASDVRLDRKELEELFSEIGS
jgi:chemotaxis protein MotA